MTTAYIALGSNVGDRAGHMAFAREELAGLPRTRLAAFSSLYETEPVGPVAMAPFLNAVAAVETELEPLDLLGHLQAIEQRGGRVRSVRWGPRTLDLDLLLYGDQLIRSPELTLPHPRLQERRFVLEPLAELAPDLRHPESGRTVREMLDEV